MHKLVMLHVVSRKFLSSAESFYSIKNFSTDPVAVGSAVANNIHAVKCLALPSLKL